MSLTFNMLMQSAGIAPSDVRLIRHQSRGPDGRTPYGLWRDDRPTFEAYQSTQQIKHRARLAGAFWASFVVAPDGRTLFAGLYRVGADRVAVPADWPYPLGPRPAANDDELYDLTPMDDLAPYIGRLTIDWGGATRTWAQRADAQDKPIIELSRTFTEPAFPGFGAFIAQLSEIGTLPLSWSTPLAAASGIYLLTCPATGEWYVGSATGADGFLGRWKQYAADGHGGDVRLKSRDPSDYQVSILEVASSMASTPEILDLESRWMAKLQSRRLGLNANGPAGGRSMLR